MVLAGGVMVSVGNAILKQEHRYLAPVPSSAAGRPAGCYMLYLRPAAIDKDRAGVRPATVQASPGASKLSRSC